MEKVKVIPLNGTETLNDFADETLVYVYTEKGRRYVHYMAFGYYRGGDDPLTSWIFNEYSNLIASEKEVIAAGGLVKWEEENQEYVRQFVDLCTGTQVFDNYMHYCTEMHALDNYFPYDTGKPPIGFLVGNGSFDEVSDGLYVTRMKYAE